MGAEESVATSGQWYFPDKSSPARSAALAKPTYRVAKNRVRSFIDPYRVEFESAKRRVESLCQNDDLALPNAYTRTIGSAILELCKQSRILPTLINPTGDESLLFEFFAGNDIYSIDVYNTGEIVYITRINEMAGDALEIEPSQLKDIIAAISHAYEREHLR